MLLENKGWMYRVLALKVEKTMAPHSGTLAWKIPWREEPGRLSPWGLEESDTIEWLHFHFSLSCIGEGHGNPLQCSCLENPRDGGAWWAAIYGVAQSQTWPTWLSSSSLERAKCGTWNLRNFRNTEKRISNVTESRLKLTRFRAIHGRTSTKQSY